jgi:hypothetical protein
VKELPRLGVVLTLEEAVGLQTMEFADQCHKAADRIPIPIWVTAEPPPDFERTRMHPDPEIRKTNTSRTNAVQDNNEPPEPSLVCERDGIGKIDQPNRLVALLVPDLDCWDERLGACLEMLPKPLHTTLGEIVEPKLRASVKDLIFFLEPVTKVAPKNLGGG